MTKEIYDELVAVSEDYASCHLRETTEGLNSREFSELIEKFSYFVRCIPSSWAPELKLRMIYTTITKTVVYDHSEDTKNLTRFTYLGGLEGKAVCMGVAELMTILCKSLGIQAETVIGYVTSDNGSGDGGLHAWNIVWLPNDYGVDMPYHLDATWDLGRCPNDVSDFYFYLKTDKYMLDNNHVWLTERYPACEQEAKFKTTKINIKAVDTICNILPRMTRY